MSNLLKPTGFFTFQKALHSKILHGDYIAFICFVWLSAETVSMALYIIDIMVFITEVESVYSAVRTESLYKKDTSRSENVN